ncbi:MAG: Cj0069 family protein, partial [Bradyrhizobium sp.]|uniref:Cj0069 family protein n=1 Tax=Bradyrhizobium sp. TaxID=376 RepID=UPI0012089892
YRDAGAFREEFPQRVRAAGPRVIKQNRGNGGEGVWKVELASASGPDGAIVRVLHAPRGSVPQEMPLGAFMSRCEPYFVNHGCIIDQPFQVRLPDGMIRCYMGADKVVGFGHQFIKALIPPPPEGPDSVAAQPAPRIMHPAAAPEFQTLRTKMESEWTPQMMQLLDIDVGSLPIIWDADFLYGPRDASGQDTYVLCEINVNSVFPFPEQAPSEIARLAKARSSS